MNPSEAWMERAACRNTPGVDPAWFFQENGTIPNHVRAICDACPVRGECLDYALRLEIDHGIFGGISAGERRKIRRAA